MRTNIYIYIAVMAIVTYLIRMLPLTLIRKKITNKFIRDFLYYVPYATLAAMTFPAILYSTSNVWAATAGFLAALVLAYRGKSLLTVAGSACVVVFILELILH
ncbi:MAG: AzlD domain-containing protein [Lachnospiraceae bacterium]|jgi:branched-subunit amino acid transport protein|nr:AzlD domain-containing protein [Lachnospiraceae bacterium]MDD3616048.1 AzlD domain-containing protein [Lachnospiraceae bacterium]